MRASRAGRARSQGHSALPPSHFSGGVPHNVQLVSLGGCAAGLSLAADRIVKCVDTYIEQALLAGVDTHLRRRGMSVAEERKVERGVGVRGGLMAIVRHKDPYFIFRCFTALYIVSAMV